MSDPKSTRSGKQRSLWQRALRGVGLSLAVIGTILLSLVGYLHTSSGQELLRGRAQAALAKRVNGAVRLDRLGVRLFGRLEIGGLVLSDSSNKPVVELDSLTIEPAWGQLLTGNLVIESVSLNGLRLHVQQYADGGSNLKQLFKPRAPSPAPKPADARRVQVRAISLSNLSVALLKPDGSELAVSGLEVSATLDAVPADKTVALDLSRVSANVTRSSPGGPRLALTDLESSLKADLVRGVGKVALGATNGKARIERPGVAPFSTDLALGGVSLDLEPGGLAGALEKLKLGLALVESIELSGATEAGALRGTQKAVIAGLHLNKDRVNALLGKPLLATDVDSKASISGPPNELALSWGVKTRGGDLTLDGRIDASKLDRPGFDLTLVGTSLSTKKLLASESAPDVEVERLELGVKGTGAKRDEIAADLRLTVGPVRIGRVRITDATVRGRFERGVLTLHELTINALEQKLTASGRYVVADRSLDAKLAITGDAGKALAELRRAGVPVRTQIPVGFVRASDGELRLEVSGKLDEGLTLRLPKSKVSLAGGRVTLDGSVALVRGPAGADGKRPLALSTLDTDVTLAGVRLSSLLALRGKKLAGMDGRVSGRISVSGDKSAPRAKIALTVTAQRTDDRSAPALRAVLDGKVQPSRADLSLAVYRTHGGASGERLLDLSAQVPMSGRRLASGRPLDVRLDLPRRDLAELLALLPPELADKIRLPPESEIEAHVELAGRTDAPSGKFSVLARTAALGLRTKQRIELAGTLEPAGKSSVLLAKVRGSLDERVAPFVELDGSVTFPRSPLLPGATRELAWKLDAMVGPHDIESLPIPDDKKRGASGRAALRVAAAGTRHDIGGKAHVSLAGVKRADSGPIDAELEVALTPEQANVAVDVTASGLDTLHARGQVGVGGRGLLDKLRNKTLGDPSLSLDVELVRHTLKEWGAVRPKLAKLLGSLGGSVHVGGTIKEPLAEGELSLKDFEMPDGRAGRAAVVLSADAQRVSTRVLLGPEGDASPLEISAKVDRGELRTFLASKQGAASVDVALRATASQKQLRALVPQLSPEMPLRDTRGTLDWDMSGFIRLLSNDGKRAVDDAALTGHLALEGGTVPIPNGKRQLHDVELRLQASRAGLTIEKLHAEESDREKPKRTLTASGRLSWDKLRPRRATLKLSAQDFLLFGTDLLGMPDAPRAALSASIDVTADLSKPRREVAAVVHELDLQMPERFDKAHWPEKIHLGDVVLLDEPGARVGKLPQPAASNTATAQATGSTATKRVDLPGSPGTDVTVHLARPIHIQKPPFEFFATGDLKVKLRPGAKPLVKGELSVIDGSFQLGGQQHRVAKNLRSRIFFDETHPGELDLFLEKPPHPAVLRDVSRVSAGGDTVRLHLTGPIGKPQSKVTGVGNADLWDILPVHNAGRVKFTSKPDMPATETVQVPREYDVVLLSYMALNLPHNLFLDRMNAWADPYDDRFAYGRIRHMEADRYSKNGKTRVRATARPATIGQSNAEIEAGYLLVNQSRTKAGAALVGGSRLGGGPALFFEWSSTD